MIFVSDISSKKVAPGQTISVFGGFFDSKTGISFDDIDATIIDNDEDFVSAIVPDISGTYDLKVTDNGSVVKTFTGVSVVKLADTPTRNPAKEYTNEDFDDYIRSLFPRGIAFAMGRESNLSKMIASFAFVIAYVWSVIRSMLNAVDPTHTSNFDEWENELSLPEIGITPEDDAGRRAEIHRVECTDGGCNISYIQKIVSLMNLSANVYEYTSDPDMFDGVDFGNDDPNFFFKIDFLLHSDEFSYFEAGVSAAGDYLMDFNRYNEESVFNRIKPSHTKIVFGYIDMTKDGVLATSDNKPLVTSDGKYLGFVFE